jgi:hypothetical protein
VTDQRGSWDLEFEPRRGALAPRGDAPARGVNLAELPVRGIAFLIDLVLIQLGSAIVLQIFLLMTRTLLAAGAGGVTDTVLAAWTGYGLPVVVLAVMHALAYVFLWRVYRASPGQMTLGLFTLDVRRGNAISKRRALLRWTLLFLPALIMSSSDAIGIVVQFGIASKLDQTAVSFMSVLLPFIWFVILTLSILINSQGRGLHDRMAKSIVVRREGSAS